MKADLNGKLVDAAEARVSPFDAGYLYGDGLFETLRSYDGFLFDLEEHLARMGRAAVLLQIPFDASPTRWSSRLGDLLGVNGLSNGDAVVRIQLSRGGMPETDHVGAAPDSLEPVEFVSARPLPEELQRWQLDGVRVMSVQSSFARGNFPQLKSLNYLPSMMALRFARASGCAEALLLTNHGQVLEGATSNVFVLKGDLLRTAPAQMHILPGIARARILELAARFGLRCEESAVEMRELKLADEVFLSSSVKEVLPVVRVDETSLGDGRPGPTTRELQEAYRQAVESARPR